MREVNDFRGAAWLDSFAGRRVFLTGHTGFVGSWTAAWLHGLGAEVAGYALAPDSAQAPLHEIIEPRVVFAASTYGDLADLDRLENALADFEPDIVLHLAAQPLVRPSYQSPRETFETNVMGTVNLLEVVRRHPDTAACVVITSDKCYENAEQIWAYRETDQVGGRDPYSASKGAAEIVTSSYARSFFSNAGGTACASARAGNIIGGGDFALDRLVPDLVRAVEAAEPIVIRNPGAVRPWQHVLESVSGYLRLAAALYEDRQEYAGGWNFGPERGAAITVAELVAVASERLGSNWPGIVQDAEPGPHEARLLSLDTSKAATYLGWEPVLDVERRVAMTFDWYLHFLTDEHDMAALTRDQIHQFQAHLVGAGG